MKKVKVKLRESQHCYEVQIGCDLLASCGDYARKVLPPTKKLAVVSNTKVFGLYGETVTESLRAAGFDVRVWQMSDGEKYKNLRSLETALAFFSENKLKRTDAVVALGGGVVGDLAGFAAAIYLRGVPFLQIPTTLLAMIDSSVGGKTGVNTAAGKNLVGAFHQPHGVLIDTATLKTLPARELTAGFCEAVKHGVIASRSLFNQTAEFLGKYPPKYFKKFYSNEDFLENLQNLVAAQIAFKAEIVMQDEKEATERNDARSRKILNFGHTVAHALEKVTDYRYFKHGEAVGYGMLVAGEISKSVANFVQSELKSFNDVVRLTGILPAADKIAVEKVVEAVSFDKKLLGKTVQWILLEEIGKPKIVADISNSIIKKSLEKILKSAP